MAPASLWRWTAHESSLKQQLISEDRGRTRGIDDGMGDRVRIARPAAQGHVALARRAATAFPHDRRHPDGCPNLRVVADSRACMRDCAAGARETGDTGGMSLRRYVASGRGGSGAILPVFLASLIVGVLVGALEGLVSQWLSLFLV